mmetsp:Transcript_2606/g.3461  ORF Transcript_2606/g.3461 Transcript_2606/m.3461 type:complete len:374 (+) Transcript_2606:75-1196(+)
MSEVQSTVVPGISQDTNDSVVLKNVPLSNVSIEDIYVLKKKIGEGSFGQVRLGIHKDTNQKHAIKIINKLSLAKNQKEMVNREVEILRLISHSNVVQLVNVYENSSFVYIVMELMEGGELLDHIGEDGFPEHEVAGFMRELVSAVRYLHSLGIVHRDIKLENAMFSRKERPCSVKLIDFGLAIRLAPGEMLNTQVGSPDYCAPEILMGGKYGIEVDMWSLGVLMYLLISASFPFEHPNGSKMVQKILAGKFSFSEEEGWDRVSDDAKDLILHLLVVNPKERYTAEQALEHPWFETAWNAGMKRSPSWSGLLSSIKTKILPLPEPLVKCASCNQFFEIAEITQHYELCVMTHTVDNKYLHRFKVQQPVLELTDT